MAPARAAGTPAPAHGRSSNLNRPMARHAHPSKPVRPVAALLTAALVVLLSGLAPLPTLGAQTVDAPAPGRGAGEPITLQQAIALAQGRGLAAASARSTLDAARWRTRAFEARFLPQLALQARPANLNRGFTPILTSAGETEFVSQSDNQSQFALALSQVLPWTGGTLSVGSELRRVDVFGDKRTQTWQTTPLLIGLRQSLFKPRTLLWDAAEQDLGASIADRQFRESREQLAGTTASAFFDLYAAQLAVENAEANAAVNDTLYQLNTGRYEVGKIGENDLLQSELALLRARAAVDGARLERDRAAAALRRLLRLPADEPVVVAQPDEAPMLQVDPEEAVAHALRNASAMEDSRLQRLRAERRVREARSANGISADIQASVGFNNTGSAFSNAYQSPRSKQAFMLDVSMPLVQWGGGRAAVEAARAEEARTASDVGARREAQAEEARFAALQLAQAQRVLAISAKADTVAAKRFEVAKNRYVIGRIDMGALYIAQSEKDGALQAYVQALRGYWNAYYQLRRLTLHDFATGQPILE